MKVGCDTPQGGVARSSAVEIEHEFWIAVYWRGPLTPAQLHALRAADPAHTFEAAQSFMARIRGASELRLGPFWPKPRALAALRVLSEVGLDGTIEA